MITSITLPNTISSDYVNIAANYYSATTTNSVSAVTTTSVSHSPATTSLKVFNDDNKNNLLLKFNVDANEEYLVDIWFYTNVLDGDYNYSGTPILPKLSVSPNELSCTILSSTDFTFIDDTYLTWKKATYKIIPNYELSQFGLIFSLDFGNLVAPYPDAPTKFIYYLSDVRITKLKLLSNPVNNLIPISIFSNLDYQSSDIVISLKNRNNSEIIADNVLFNVGDGNLARIDVAPLLKNYITPKWDNIDLYSINNLTIADYNLNTVNRSNDTSGIIPLELGIYEKLNGALVTGITSGTTGAIKYIELTFSEPFDGGSVGVYEIGNGTYVSLLTLPEITLSTDNLKISDVTYVFGTNKIQKVKLITTSGTSATYTGTLEGYGVFQVVGNLISRQNAPTTTYKGFSAFKGSYTTWNWNDRKYELNEYFNKILSTFPRNEYKPIIKNSMEFISVINSPYNNLLDLYLPDGTLINFGYTYSVSLNTDGVDFSNTLQLEIPYIITGEISQSLELTDNTATVTDRIKVKELDCSVKTGQITATDILNNSSNYIKLFWINRLGGWESFFFRKNNIISDTEKDLLYRKTRSVLSDGNILYNGTIQNSLSVSSGFLTKNVSLWMKELFESGNIYLYQNGLGKNQLIPVNIKETNFTSFNSRTSIREYNFTIEYASTNRVNL